MRIFRILSLTFVGLFIVTAIGSVATALAYDRNWYMEDLSTWTYSSMLQSCAVMLATLLIVAVLRIRQLESGPSSASDDPPGDVKPKEDARKSVWRIVAGPIFITVLIMTISAIMLPLSTDFADANFRLNNALILFISYSASLLPSYIVVSTVALLRLPGGQENA